MSLFFIILSIIIYLIGFIPYIYHVFHGRVVPHPFSWTVWMIFSVISGYFLYIDHGPSISLIPVIIRSLALMIGMSIGWYMVSRVRISRTDIIALSLALLMILVMQYTESDGVISLMIIIDLLVLTPTIRKIWDNPHSEDPFAWLMSSASIICFLCSLGEFTFSNVGFWIYLVCINTLVALLIYRRCLYLSHWFPRIREIVRSIIHY